MGLLCRLLHVSQSCLECGDGFALPDPPRSVTEGMPVDLQAIRALQPLLVQIGLGEVVAVDLDEECSSLVAQKDATALLKQAKAEGRQAWLILRR